MLEAATREHETINYIVWFEEIHDRGVARKIGTPQYQKLHDGSCALKGDIVQHIQKVIVSVIVHDLIARRWLRGASD